MKTHYRIIVILISLLLVSCTSQERLESALDLAGDNKTELEKVLLHYKNEPQKLEAARFVISNMPGGFSVNPEMINRCRPFYAAYDSLNREYNYIINSSWGKTIDSLWICFSHKNQELQKNRADITTLKADYVISEIELAFRAWKGNVYSRNCSFNDFCEYILPYRRQNGLLADNARKTFYERHQNTFFNQEDRNFQDEVDSLLYQYRHLVHSQFWGTKIPIMDANTFETLRHGLCAQRCWYNSLLLSSLGMPAAVDFVPAWGNRNSSHTWNVVMVDGESYAFEAFWDMDRWKYKRIYNNRTIDAAWGKFRLPKVYRYTYSNHIEGPMADTEVSRRDIPDLFLNMKVKDVSSEYFETQDLEVKLSGKVPDDVKYAYLAVYGNHRWHPVQWGRIDGNTVQFKSMGKDIVYLPVYYKNGYVQSAGLPLWLKEDGSIKVLEANSECGSLITSGVLGYSDYGRNSIFMSCMKGTKIFGLKEDGDTELVCTLDRLLAIERTYLPVTSCQPYRFIRLELPSDSIVLGDLSFYTDKGRIKNTKVISPVSGYGRDSLIYALTDGIDATVFKGKVSDNYLDIDLGTECMITQIGVTPCLFSQIHATDDYELMYWIDGSWQRFSTDRETTDSYLVFNRIPKDALFLLKNNQSKGEGGERTFIYENGSVVWQ